MSTKSGAPSQRGRISASLSRRAQIDLVAPDFYKRAACRGADPELFFDPDNEPVAGRPGHTRDKMSRREQARQYCDRCPVTEQCLAIGFASSDGIFGGLDKDERRRLVRNGRRNPAAVAVPEPEGLTGVELTQARDIARTLLRRGKGVREVMLATNMTYDQVLQTRTRMLADHRVDAPRWERPDPPKTWGPGTECYQWWERRWLAGQYLGQRPDGKILVQSKSQGPTVRRWCDPQDVAIRPGVERYQAMKGNRKDLDVGKDPVNSGDTEASADAA